MEKTLEVRGFGLRLASNVGMPSKYGRPRKNTSEMTLDELRAELDAIEREISQEEHADE